MLTRECFRAMVVASVLTLGMLTLSGADEPTARRLAAYAVMRHMPKNAQLKEYVNLAVSPDSKRLYATAKLELAAVPPRPEARVQGALECWEVTEQGAKHLWSADFHPWWQSRGPFALLKGLAISPDGKYLALSMLGEATLFDSATGRPMRSLKAELEVGVTDRLVKGLVFSADGKELVGFHRGTTAQVWDVATGQTLRRWQLADIGLNSIQCAQITPDNQLLAVAGVYGRIGFWSLKTKRLVRTWDFDEKSEATFDLELVRMGEKTYWLAARGSGLMGHPFQEGKSEGVVVVLDETGKVVHRLVLPGLASAVAVSPNGGQFAGASIVRSWQKRPVLPGEPIPRRPIMDRFDWPSAAYVWETETGKRLAVLEGHQQGITDVVWSPNGQWIATCSLDGTIRLWRVPENLR